MPPTDSGTPSGYYFTTTLILILATQLVVRSVITIDQSEIHVKARLWAKHAEEFNVTEGTR